MNDNVHRVVTWWYSNLKLYIRLGWSWMVAHWVPVAHGSFSPTVRLHALTFLITFLIAFQSGARFWPGAINNTMAWFGHAGQDRSSWLVPIWIEPLSILKCNHECIGGLRRGATGTPPPPPTQSILIDYFVSCINVHITWKKVIQLQNNQ